MSARGNCLRAQNPSSPLVLGRDAFPRLFGKEFHGAHGAEEELELLRADGSLWAILTEPSKWFGRWDEGEFFETGVKQIAGVMETIQSLGIDVARGRALDFGCGVGRLTQALCDAFWGILRSGYRRLDDRARIVTTAMVIGAATS